MCIRSTRSIVSRCSSKEDSRRGYKRRSNAFENAGKNVLLGIVDVDKAISIAKTRECAGKEGIVEKRLPMGGETITRKGLEGRA